jgi:hypothetical protein
MQNLKYYPTKQSYAYDRWFVRRRHHLSQEMHKNSDYQSCVDSNPRQEELMAHL